MTNQTYKAFQFQGAGQNDGAYSLYVEIGGSCYWHIGVSTRRTNQQFYRDMGVKELPDGVSVKTHDLQKNDLRDLLHARRMIRQVQLSVEGNMNKEPQLIVSGVGQLEEIVELPDDLNHDDLFQLPQRFQYLCNQIFGSYLS